MGRKDYSAGQVFGRLTILGEDTPKYRIDSRGRKRKVSRFRVKCNCSKQTEFTVEIGSLSSGATRGCGCLQKEAVTKHGMSNTPTFSTWCAMRWRCTNPSDDNYPNYGAVGITVCDRWLEKFEYFLEDMGERPDGHTLNRKNGAKIYSKETCEWANGSVQNFDQRMSARNKSGKTGIHLHQESGKWCAGIGYEGKYILLGYFIDFDDALAARLEAEEKYYGFTKD